MRLRCASLAFQSGPKRFTRAKALERQGNSRAAPRMSQVVKFFRNANLLGFFPVGLNSGQRRAHRCVFPVGRVFVVQESFYSGLTMLRQSRCAVLVQTSAKFSTSGRERRPLCSKVAWAVPMLRATHIAPDRRGRTRSFAGRTREHASLATLNTMGVLCRKPTSDEILSCISLSRSTRDFWRSQKSRYVGFSS
jgi:hypothetical protein